MDAHRAAEEAARSSYGRLVAYLSARSRDLAAAEDALGEAFRAALTTWPQRGVRRSRRPGCSRSRAAYTRAIGLSQDGQEREFLATRARSLE